MFNKDKHLTIKLKLSIFQTEYERDHDDVTCYRHFDVSIKTFKNDLTRIFQQNGTAEKFHKILRKPIVAEFYFSTSLQIY